MEDMIEESESLELCPVCNAIGTELGTLGNLRHYRCRNCGVTYSVPVEFRWDDDTTEHIATFLGLNK